jgi:hypothetical protein
LEISFDYNYAGLFVLLAVFLAAAISYLLYFRNPENFSLSNAQKRFLVLLRFLSLVLIFLFLLSPLINRTKKIKQLPVLAIALDNSRSAVEYTRSFNEFTQNIKKEFADDYQLELWTFGEKVENSDKYTGAERSSDYGQLIKSMKSYYTNKNIGALILVGDGIYNQGQNPANMAGELRFPVYTIGVGDTTRKIDAIIRKVKTNKTAYLKNKFPVEIELNFSKLNNQIAYIDIENNSEKVYSGTISINSDDNFRLELVNLEATRTGMQHYKIRIRPFAGEANLKNNEFEFAIQVLENKQRILLLSDGPHPDMGAIRNSLSELQNYETKLITGSNIPDSLSSYNLIILNQLPSLKNAASKLLTQIITSRIPVLFITGPNSMTEQLNSLDAGIKITTSKNTEEVQPKFDNNFSLFIISDETKQVLESAPPLIAPFGNTDLKASFQALAYQSIKNIPTAKTLMAFGTNKSRKVGFINGEGIWRWRLYDFEANGNHDAINELIHKSVQYLALRENEDNFNVYYPAVFQETDNIEFSAELYNDSYELLNTPDVNISIKDTSMHEFKYLFDRVGNTYRLNAGNMEPGDYTFEANTQLGNQNYTENGNFSIIKNELEIQNKQADFNVLYQLAERSGGNLFPYKNYSNLPDSIRKNKQITVVLHKQTLHDEWINLKIMFLLLVSLMGTEWFFRKYWGIY